MTAASPEEILTSDCDIFAPCALGGVINVNLARKLQCKIIAGAANNVLGDPDEDAVALRNQGITYVPDFVANAGGLIQLAGTYLGLTPQEIDQKISSIEHTTTRILQDAESMPSTYAAAIAFANTRIMEGHPGKEQVHAG